MLESTEEVHDALRTLHVRLLRKARRQVKNDRWERALITFCRPISKQDAWELERFGYKQSDLGVKLRCLKNLCEVQFDRNKKFKDEVNKSGAGDLRLKPLGRDRHGNNYWYQLDTDLQLRIYREDVDDETWTVVAEDRAGMVALVAALQADSAAQSEDVSQANSEDEVLQAPVRRPSGLEEAASPSSAPQRDDAKVFKQKSVAPVRSEKVAARTARVDVISVEEKTGRNEGADMEVDIVTEDTLPAEVPTEDSESTAALDKDANAEKHPTEPTTNSSPTEDPPVLSDSAAAVRLKSDDKSTLPEDGELRTDLTVSETADEPQESEHENDADDSEISAAKHVESTNEGDRIAEKVSQPAPAAEPGGPPGTESGPEEVLRESMDKMREEGQISHVESSVPSEVTAQDELTVSKTESETLSRSKGTKGSSQLELEDIATNKNTSLPNSAPTEECRPTMQNSQPSVPVTDANPSLSSQSLISRIPRKQEATLLLKDSAQEETVGQPACAESCVLESSLKVSKSAGSPEVNAAAAANEVESAPDSKQKSEKEEVQNPVREGEACSSLAAKVAAETIEAGEQVTQNTAVSEVPAVHQTIRQEALQNSDTKEKSCEIRCSQEKVVKAAEAEERLTQNPYSSNMTQEEQTSLGASDDTQTEQAKGGSEQANHAQLDEQNYGNRESKSKPSSKDSPQPDAKVREGRTTGESDKELTDNRTVDKENTDEEAKAAEIPLEEAVRQSHHSEVSAVEADRVPKDDGKTESSKDSTVVINESQLAGDKCSDGKSIEEGEDKKKLVIEGTDKALELESESTSALKDADNEERGDKALEVMEGKQASHVVPTSPVAEESQSTTNIQGLEPAERGASVAEESASTASNLIAGEDRPVSEDFKRTVVPTEQQLSNPDGKEDEMNPEPVESIDSVPEESTARKSDVSKASAEAEDISEAENKIEGDVANEDSASAWKPSFDPSLLVDSENINENTASAPDVTNKDEKSDLKVGLEKADSSADMTADAAEKLTENQSMDESGSDATAGDVDNETNFSKQPDELRSDAQSSDSAHKADNKGDDLGPLGVSAAVEDPPVVVKGSGSGALCEGGNSLPSDWIGEAVEEPPLVIQGLGWGALCDVGNGVRAKKRGGRVMTGSNGHPEPTVTNEGADPVAMKSGIESGAQPDNMEDGSGEDEVNNDEAAEQNAGADSEISSGAKEISAKDDAETDMSTKQVSEKRGKPQVKPAVAEGGEGDHNAKEDVVETSASEVPSEVKVDPAKAETADKASVEGKDGPAKAEADNEPSMEVKADPVKTEAVDKISQEMRDAPTEDDGLDGEKSGGAEPVESTSKVTPSENNVSAEAQVKKRGRKRRVELLENTEAAEPTAEAELESSVTRRSSRVARLRERELQQRKIEEEERLRVLKEQNELRKIRQMERSERKANKKDKKKKKKRDHKVKHDEEDGDEDDVPLKEMASKKKKKKRKKKKQRRGTAGDPWQSSSASSSSSSDAEDELFAEHELHGEDGDELVFRSDHEFSPESENDQDWVPVQHARTARSKRRPVPARPASPASSSEDADLAEEDRCRKCLRGDHPELILLCDGCDCGWHTNCVRPPLLSVPEGNWYCPTCEHTRLIQSLTTRLEEYDVAAKQREVENLRKQRLEYVNISMGNVIQAPLRNKKRKRRRDSPKSDQDGAAFSGGSGADSSSESGDSESGESESESDDSDESESASDSSEPVYTLRARRPAADISDRVKQFDEMINDAIRDELDMVRGAGNAGRGKSMENIVEAEAAERAEEAAKEREDTAADADAAPDPDAVDAPPEQPPAVKEEEGKADKAAAKEEAGSGEDSEEVVAPRPLPAILTKRRKRRINDLDDPSDDDDDDKDESFHATEEEEDDDDDEFAPEESEDSELEKKRRKSARQKPTRRSGRTARRRYDTDDSSEEEWGRKRRRAAASMRDFVVSEDSDESSDGAWGRKKKKPKRAPVSKKKRPAKGRGKKKAGGKVASRKKRSASGDSAAPAPKRKVKYAKADPEPDPDPPARRTRGKVTNYAAILESESDSDTLKPIEPMSFGRRTQRSSDDSGEEFKPNLRDKSESEDDKMTKKQTLAMEEELEDEEEEDSDEDMNTIPQKKSKPAPPPALLKRPPVRPIVSSTAKKVPVVQRKTVVRPVKVPIKSPVKAAAPVVKRAPPAPTRPMVVEKTGPPAKVLPSPSHTQLPIHPQRTASPAVTQASGAVARPPPEHAAAPPQQPPPPDARVLTPGGPPRPPHQSPLQGLAAMRMPGPPGQLPPAARGVPVAMSGGHMMVRPPPHYPGGPGPPPHPGAVPPPHPGATPPSHPGAPMPPHTHPGPVPGHPGALPPPHSGAPPPPHSGAAPHSTAPAPPHSGPRFHPHPGLPSSAAGPPPPHPAYRPGVHGPYHPGLRPAVSMPGGPAPGAAGRPAAPPPPPPPPHQPWRGGPPPLYGVRYGPPPPQHAPPGYPGPRPAELPPPPPPAGEPAPADPEPAAPLDPAADGSREFGGLVSYFSSQAQDE